MDAIHVFVSPLCSIVVWFSMFSHSNTNTPSDPKQGRDWNLLGLENSHDRTPVREVEEKSLAARVGRILSGLAH